MPTYPFDKRFLNFADPEVLKLMVGDELEKNWKETYGFDHASYLNDSSKVKYCSCSKENQIQSYLYLIIKQFTKYKASPSFNAKIQTKLKNLIFSASIFQYF